ncbi:MAG: oligosaccharide flippase family protein [Bacteroidota bacterium]|nr:oligosaccharide flippase family protein [Bacteroidota bacterium]
MKLLPFIHNQITFGNERSIKAKKHIFLSLGIKGIGILVSFILVPLTLNYIGTKNYGIWLTLSSIVALVGSFDIGVGNGMRNKFAEAIAKNQKELAKIYVSTTYALFFLIFTLFFLIFLLINPLLNWVNILSASTEIGSELKPLIIFVVFFFLLRFILNLIATILQADQRPTIKNSINSISNIVALIVIFILTKTTTGSLLFIGITMSAAPVFMLIIFSIYFFSKDYKEYIPRIKYVKLKYSKELVRLGLKFFLMQISVIIIFESDNIIINQVLCPEEVVTFNIAYKYFHLMVMFVAIIVTPYWSAFTEAYVKKDIEWIKNTVRNLRKLWLGVIVLLGILLIFSNDFYFLWVGDKISVPFVLSAFMALYVLVWAWETIHSILMDGTSKIHLKTIFLLIAAIFNIPVSIILAKHFGTAGVIMATSIVLLPPAIINTIQYNKIVSGRAKGIWGK